MSKSGRLATALLLLFVAAGLVVFAAMSFIRSSPSTVDFAEGHQPSQPVNLTIQTVGTIGFGVHPSWVSYLVETPQGKWLHTTLWQLPAHTKINVTILQFDSGSPLRNQELGVVTGVQNSTLNGARFTLVNSNATSGLGQYGVGHTFTVPELGINVPLPGNNGSAKNFCSVPAPCPLSSAHNTLKFSFTTPGPGSYRWQCFVPCGLGFLYGNGGPMQTIGYMGGFLEVQ
jgi:heme/copper-type cytochrome/quinol oxidase subunit 2